MALAAVDDRKADITNLLAARVGDPGPGGAAGIGDEAVGTVLHIGKHRAAAVIGHHKGIDLGAGGGVTDFARGMGRVGISNLGAVAANAPGSKTVTNKVCMVCTTGAASREIMTIGTGGASVVSGGGTVLLPYSG